MSPRCRRCGQATDDVLDGTCLACELTVAILKGMQRGRMLLNQRGEYQERNVTQQTRGSAVWN